MAHTHISPKTLRFATSSFLVTGIGMLSGVSFVNLYAQQTAPGAILVHEAVAQGSTILPPSGFIATMMPTSGIAGVQFVIGILLVMIGFFFHALYLVRTQEPVNLPHPKHVARKIKAGVQALKPALR